MRTTTSAFCTALLACVLTACGEQQQAPAPTTDPNARDAAGPDVTDVPSPPTVVAAAQRTGVSRPLIAGGESCGDAVVLTPGALVSDETRTTGTPNHLCAPSDAPQRYFSFTLPAHQRALVTVTPTSGVRVVARAMKSCAATDCLRDATTTSDGASVTLAIDSPDDEPLNKIVTVSTQDPMLTASFDIGVRLIAGGGCRESESPAVAYQITEIAAPAGFSGILLNGVNERHEIVGTAADSVGTHGFIWRDGVPLDLGSLGGAVNNALAINGNGQIVGNAGTATTAHAFVWENGVITDLGTGSGIASGAQDINESGLIVGLYASMGVLRTSEWDHGAFLDLGVGGTSNSFPAALNDFGQVTGTLSDTGHAFLWDRGVTIDVGTGGTPFSRATDVNNSGEVIGWIVNDGRQHSFRWHQGQFRLLAPAGIAEVAHALNDAGVIVGSLDEGAGARAFAVPSGVVIAPLTDLNTRIPSTSGWTLTDARAIDRCGDIVGVGEHGGNITGFLLTPVTCAAGQTLCDNRCVDTNTDRTNCGACGFTCPAACIAGVCAREVCNGIDDDGDGLIDNGLAPLVCGVGACVRAVPSCVAGTMSSCTPGAPGTESCNGVDDDCNGIIDDGCGPGCSTGQSLCGTVCTSLAFDGMNCGACGNVCQGLSSCIGGTCVCRGGTTNCGGVCVATNRDPMNCGACGTVCTSGLCAMGVCVSSCPSGLEPCGGTCVSIASDSSNCGGCGVVCPAGTMCAMGTCR